MMSARRTLMRGIMPLCFALLVSAACSAAEYISTSVHDKVKAATVMVHIEYDAPYENQISWGTGFVVGDGLVMTNAHVVSDRMPKRIYVHNEYLPVTEAQVVTARYDTNGSNPMGSDYYDVALLSFSPPMGARLPVLSFALQASPHEDVFAFGFPGPERQGYGTPLPTGRRAPPRAPLSVTGGTVNDVIQVTPRLLMHDALCKTGNSGGPLINARGEVVGMQTWSADPDHRNVVVSFAIEGRSLAEFIQRAGYRPAIGG